MVPVDQRLGLDRDAVAGRGRGRHVGEQLRAGRGGCEAGLGGVPLVSDEEGHETSSRLLPIPLAVQGQRWTNDLDKICAERPEWPR